MEAERRTRTQRIDPKLNAAGWSVVSYEEPRQLGSALAIEEYPTDAGPADYVLVHRAQLWEEGLHDGCVALLAP